LRAALTVTFEKVMLGRGKSGDVYLLPILREEAVVLDRSPNVRRIPLNYAPREKGLASREASPAVRRT
jgi:hypothetical protein